MRGCKLLINWMCNALHRCPFPWGITDVNEIRKRIVHILEYIVFSFTKDYVIYRSYQGIGTRF